jgi:hypothetical protein
LHQLDERFLAVTLFHPAVHRSTNFSGTLAEVNEQFFFDSTGSGILSLHFLGTPGQRQGFRQASSASRALSL